MTWVSWLRNKPMAIVGNTLCRCITILAEQETALHSKHTGEHLVRAMLCTRDAIACNHALSLPLD